MQYFPYGVEAQTSPVQQVPLEQLWFAWIQAAAGVVVGVGVVMTQAVVLAHFPLTQAV